MRIEPKDFQDSAVLRLNEEIESARREIDPGRPQAVVLSSPTGSGKTVIVTLSSRKKLESTLNEVLEGVGAANS